MERIVYQLAGLIEAIVIVGMLFTAFKIIRTLAVASSKK